jgi:hypothetical protein
MRGRARWRAYLLPLLCLCPYAMLIRSASATEPSATEIAVDEFISKEQALWDRRRNGHITSSDWETMFNALLESEAKRLQSVMPDVLQTLGERLAYRSDLDRQLEELLSLSHPTTDQTLEIQALLHEKYQAGSVPRCGIAFLAGYLGRLAPANAVRILLASVPPPERSQDSCYIQALMIIGPPAYKPILEHISVEDDRNRAYFATMALVAQTTKTDFPLQAGLGRQEKWERSFPKSIRGLRRLSREWEEWWNAHENEYLWNPKTSLLESKQ